MGLAATFSVTASGSGSLVYQWRKDGAPIAGATAATYTTAPTAFADTGASFDVAVSDSAGSVESQPAQLSVTARAPKAGDLRFQQVDAASTVNGYYTAVPPGETTGIPARDSMYATYSIGTPLFIDPLACTATKPVTPGIGCTWQLSVIYLPAKLDVLNLSSGYASGYLEDLQPDLASARFPAGSSAAIDAPNSVVTSLDLEPVDGLFAASYIQTGVASGDFDLAQHTVSTADFPAAAAQEGAQSRVITAVAYNAGQVLYFSYGWQGDTSTVYETSVVPARAESAAAAAASLASQGYILTALGGSNVNDSYLLVGTRVQGDTMARPFLSAVGGGSAGAYAIYGGGYALVGVVQNSQEISTLLGER